MSQQRWVLHIDLDQFIAAVEVLRRPELRGKPVIVGGDGDPTKRGVVATASYEARAFGIGSGTPLRTAARRCPDAVFLPVDKPAYEAASAQVVATLRSFPGPLEVLGWDEAFLAIDSSDPESVARDIQHAVRSNTGLECSIGIGTNRLQAKLATGFAKGTASRVFQLTHDNWFEVLGDQPPDALWGIGAKTAKRLHELGIATVNQLAATSPRWLAERLGPTLGPWYVQIARGEGSAQVYSGPYQARSRSREVTFQQDLSDWAEIRSRVVELAGKVAEDVVAEGRPAVRLVIKVRYRPFTTRTHGRRLDPPTFEAAALCHAAVEILHEFRADRPVRLVGVRAEFGR